MEYYGIPLRHAEELMAVTDPKGADRRITRLSLHGRGLLSAFASSRGLLKPRQVQFASFGVRDVVAS
jgi:hypothetical protein